MKNLNSFQTSIVVAVMVLMILVIMAVKSKYLMTQDETEEVLIHKTIHNLREE